MPDTARARTGLQASKGDVDTVSTIDDTMKAAYDKLETLVAIDAEGVYAARGTPVRGKYYWCTDRKILLRGNGAGTFDAIMPQRRVQDVVGVTAAFFAGLDGSTDLAYRLIFEGYWDGTTDTDMNLRNPDASAAVCLHRRCWTDGAIHDDTLVHYKTTDILIGGHYFGAQNVIVGEILIQAATQPNSRVISGRYTTRADTTAINQPILMGDISGYWVGSTNLTELIIDFGGQTFNGRLILENVS